VVTWQAKCARAHTGALTVKLRLIICCLDTGRLCARRAQLTGLCRVTRVTRVLDSKLESSNFLLLEYSPRIFNINFVTVADRDVASHGLGGSSSPNCRLAPSPNKVQQCVLWLPLNHTGGLPTPSSPSCIQWQ